MVSDFRPSSAKRRAPAFVGVVAVVAVGAMGCANRSVIADKKINQDVLHDVVEDTARVREHPAPSPRLKARASNQARLQAFLEQMWEVEQRRVENEARLLRRLGILSGPPRRLGPPKASTLIGGYYDPRSKTLFVVEDYALWVRAQYFLLTAITGVDWAYDTVLSHEIVHALQDQRIDLDALLDEKERDDFDAALARRAIIESDANITSLFYGNNISPKGYVRREIAFGYARLNDWFSRLFLQFDDAAARFGTRRAMGNYTLGLAFIKRVLHDGGYPALQTLYVQGRWPQSSEQLLDPSKYFDRDAYDPPLEFPALDAVDVVDAAPGFQHVDTNTFGAWQLQLYLEEMLSWSLAPASIAHRWGGDRYDFFSHGDRSLFVWRLAFDDEDAATTFFAVWRQLLAARFPGRLQTLRDDEIEYCATVAPGEDGVFSAPKESLCVQQNGKRVVVVEGVPDDRAPSLSKSILRRFSLPAPAPFPARPVAHATDNLEVEFPRAKDTLFLPPRTLSLRFGLRGQFTPASETNGFNLVPDMAAAWTARKGLMLSLPFAATIALPLGDAQNVANNPWPKVVPTITAGWIRGALTDPAVAAGVVVDLHPGFAIAGHLQLAARRVFQAERRFETRSGGGFVVAIGPRVLFAPAVALVSRAPVQFSKPPAFVIPTLEVGAAHLRGLTRLPLIEVQLFDAIGAYFDAAWAFDIHRPKLREHVYAAGLSLIF